FYLIPSLQVVYAGMNPIQVAPGIEKTAKALVLELKSMSRGKAGKEEVLRTAKIVVVIRLLRLLSIKNELPAVLTVKFDR
ncbi:unnamed protein product, partial [Brassica oleracea var. botrytis]